jgi:uncharacterized protein
MGAAAPTTVGLAIRGPITRADLPGLCDRVCALLRDAPGAVVLCDVHAVEPDAVTVDVLCRLQLAARRHGCQVRLRHASRELLELVEFMGLTDVLPDREKEETMTENGARKMFLNLAVKDLDRSVRFFTELGFSFDPRFTDETATCMVVSDEAFVMLLVEDRFKDFTSKDLADPGKETEAIMGLSADSREQVDELANRAIELGGSPAADPVEMEGVYSRSFNDPDGHHWELIWMDVSAMEPA